MTDPAASQPAPQPAAPLSPAEDIQWGSFAHLGGILGLLPALIIWLIFKDRGPFTNSEGKEALNFQITLLIVEIIGWVTSIAFCWARFNLLRRLNKVFALFCRRLPCQ